MIPRTAKPALALSLLALSAIAPAARAQGQVLILKCDVTGVTSKNSVKTSDDSSTMYYKISDNYWATWDKDKFQWSENYCSKNFVQCTVQDTFLEQKMSSAQTLIDTVINRATGSYKYGSILTITDPASNQADTYVSKLTGQCGATSDPSADGQRKF